MSHLSDKIILWKCKIVSYIENIWYEFIYQYEYYIRPYYNIKNGIRSLFYWFPVIWDDRPWDFIYTYIVMRHSIKRLHDTIDRNRRHIGDERDIKRMKICLNLLDRIIADDYYENAFKFHDKKWGSLRMWGEPDYNESGEQGKCSRMVFHRKNILTNEDKCLEDRSYKICLKNASRNSKYDLEFLHNMLSKYSKSWWD